MPGTWCGGHETWQSRSRSHVATPRTDGRTMECHQGPVAGEEGRPGCDGQGQSTVRQCRLLCRQDGYSLAGFARALWPLASSVSTLQPLVQERRVHANL